MKKIRARQYENKSLGEMNAEELRHALQVYGQDEMKSAGNGDRKAAERATKREDND